MHLGESNWPSDVSAFVLHLALMVFVISRTVGGMGEYVVFAGRRTDVGLSLFLGPTSRGTSATIASGESTSPSMKW